MQGWMFVLQLPAVGEVGVEILFRLLVLISLWILVPAVEKRDRLVATGLLGVLQQEF
jgi:hypothetical protein